LFRHVFNQFASAELFYRTKVAKNIATQNAGAFFFFQKTPPVVFPCAHLASGLNIFTQLAPHSPKNSIFAR
jgi:hypothetical protein